MRKVEECRSDFGAQPLHMSELLQRIGGILPELQSERESPTLQRLAGVLDLYASLTTVSTDIWSAILGAQRSLPKGSALHPIHGGLFALLETLDQLAGSERRALAPGCRSDCKLLREAVAHYLALPVGEFEQRGIALGKAHMTPPPEPVKLGVVESRRQSRRGPALRRSFSGKREIIPHVTVFPAISAKASPAEWRVE